ncbi:MAG: hypothetical protein M1815_003797 [Lichina confinis]|nr:MAG: hypothetical protein M1815_003797 [Lichina confinis]
MAMTLNVVRSQFAPHGEVEHLESRLREKSEECAWYRRQLADSQRDRHNADRAVESLRLALQGKDERIRILQEQVDGRRSLMFGIRGQGAGANTGAPINRYAASPAADQLGGVTGPSSPDLGPSGLQLSSMPMGMDIGRALDDIFDDARRWALQHAPFRGGQVTDVPERLQSVLQRLTEPTYYMLLLWDPHRRWALITKVIVSYIVNEVLACDLLLGFRDDWDRLLAHSKEARRDGRQYTDSAKRAFFFRFAELVRDFLHEPGALNFLRAKFEAACEHLYTLLTPLMWWDTQPGPARVSLAAIISIAFRMHLAMYSAPVEWHFDYPPVAAAFNARVHTSRDEVASSFADAAAPAAPVAAVPVVGNRIRLAITPVVIKRDHNAQTLLVSTVRRSDVLLMP